MWRPPQMEMPTVAALSFAELAFDGDPGRVPRTSELNRQAMEVGRLVTNPEYLCEFGLVDPGEPHADDVVSVDAPTVESVRVARRVGPDGNVDFNLVAEVTQRVVRRHKEKLVELHGGSTVLIDPWGKVRLVIRKRVLREDHDREAMEFITSPEGKVYWKTEKGVQTPQRAAFRIVHGHRLKSE